MAEKKSLKDFLPVKTLRSVFKPQKYYYQAACDASQLPAKIRKSICEFASEDTQLHSRMKDVELLLSKEDSQWKGEFHTTFSLLLFVAVRCAATKTNEYEAITILSAAIDIAESLLREAVLSCWDIA